MPVRPHAHGEGGEEPEVPRRRGARGEPPRNVDHAQEQVREAAEDGHITTSDAATASSSPGPVRTSEDVTQLSGTPGSAPDGRPTLVRTAQTAEGRRSIDRENSAAVTLAGKGFRIKQNPSSEEVAAARAATGDIGRPESEPDYLLEGRVFDCSSPAAGTAPRGVWSGVRKKIRKEQTQRVVVNLEDWDGDLTALRKQFDDWPIARAKEVKAITPDGEIVQLVPGTAGE